MQQQLVPASLTLLCPLQRLWVTDTATGKLRDHFTLGRLVNSGSTGTVRTCTDNTSGLEYAVKVC